ncbi:hypothetical protein C8Q75DRAFT_454144 [Abortiporus biennis]|nr:hypothetical protein C8Q75DRAFT_454144 [Abortiporus biennis]
MTSPKIPQELLYPILDNLDDDLPTLCACSIVAKAWLWPSRSYIFGNLTVNCVSPLRDDDYTLSILLPFLQKHPDICAHVQSLRLRPGRSSTLLRRALVAPSIIAAFLSLCPRLHTVKLLSVDFVGKSLLPIHTSPRFHLKELHFVGQPHAILKLDALLDLLGFFSSIERLDLMFVDPDTVSWANLGKELNNGRVSKNLKISEIACAGRFLSIVLRTDLSSLHEASVSFHKLQDLQLTADLLTTADNIVFCHFVITPLLVDIVKHSGGPFDSWPTLRLSDCKQLRTMSLRGMVMEKLPFMSQFTFSSFVEIITLLPITVEICTLWIDMIGNPRSLCSHVQSLDWPKLTRALSSRVEPMKKVEIIFSTDTHHSWEKVQCLHRLREHAKEALSELQSSVLLEVQGYIGDLPALLPEGMLRYSPRSGSSVLVQ